MWNITVAGPLKQNKILSYNAETKTSKIQRYVGAYGAWTAANGAGQRETARDSGKRRGTAGNGAGQRETVRDSGKRRGTAANGAGQRQTMPVQWKTVLERHQQLRRSTQRRKEGPTMRNVRRDEDALKTDEDGSNGCSGREQTLNTAQHYLILSEQWKPLHGDAFPILSLAVVTVTAEPPFLAALPPDPPPRKIECISQLEPCNEDCPRLEPPLCTA
ncbi:hypothetical protein LR48_Vigan05g168300 [Vigna angularis]|uniref:Uncharacterized protein n=1 Tax=Phaseolus angularis TaxID=3914 RepID=A0A0L9UMW2_PHAAN|nr:hypothetical protein LR48_Vigan05g168300 [Vigna angularis]